MNAAQGPFYRHISLRFHRIAGLPGRRGRGVILICIALISVSLCLAALLALYFQREQALQQADDAAQDQAVFLLAAAEGNLDRIAAIGLMFANGGLAEEAVAALPGISAIAVSDRSGNTLRQSTTNSRGGAAPIDTLAIAPLMRRDRMVIGSENHGTLVLRDHDRLIVVTFDPATLVPPALMTRASLSGTSGVRLAGQMPENALPKNTLFTDYRLLHGLRWPVALHYSPNDTPREAWGRLVPLYLFLALTPLLLGGWLMLVFSRALDWRARAAKLIRALRHSRPRDSKLRMRLALAERQAGEKRAERSLTYARLARDICTPLTAVCGFAELIAREWFGPHSHPRYGEYARNISAAGLAIRAQLSAAGELATLDSGRQRLCPEPCDTAALVGGTLRAQSGRAYARRVRLELAQPVPVTVYVDTLLADRLLTALLTKAIGQSRAGEVVQVSIREEPGAAIIAITRVGRPTRAAINREPDIDTIIATEQARLMGGALRFVTGGQGIQTELRLPKA